jgi:bifunctional non-homologous end joining protein LigD
MARPTSRSSRPSGPSPGRVTGRLEFPIDPMKAILGPLPPQSEDGQWAYEVKWDGYRTIAFVDGARLRLQSTHFLDVSAKYPEIGGLAHDVHAGSAVLDGEIVVMDDRGRPRFELLQRHEQQAQFLVFDVLALDGHDVTALPYEQRRSLVAQAVEPGSNWRVPAHQIGDGAALLEATREQELEGVMAKRLGSPYQPGRRSPNWRKVKNRITTEVTIGGFSAGTGNRSSTFGALLVGRRHESGALRFAGGVGSGFDQRRLEDLTRRFAALRTDECPFDPMPPRPYLRGATWVRPELRATVEITEFTNEGYVRQATFVDLVE